MSERQLSYTEVFHLSLCWADELFTTMVTQLATKNETKINWGGLAIAMASHGLWLAAEDSPRAGGGRADCNVFLLSASFFGTYKCVFVYSMCMRATIVYIYLCDSIVIFECEAHFNMIIVPASVCGGHEVMEGFTWFTVRLSFGRGEGGRGGGRWLSRCLRVRGAVCSLSAGQSPVSRRGGGLFDDLRTVAPGFGLPLGQGQPGRLRGLRRVTGGEALWHLLDSRWRRCRVCDLHWNMDRKNELDMCGYSPLRLILCKGCNASDLDALWVEAFILYELFNLKNSEKWP